MGQTDASEPRLSIIVPSCGRSTLAATLTSAAPQMRPGDELLCGVNDDAPYGHKARNELMERAQGTALLFMDDDDVFVACALAAVRHALRVHPLAVHIFRMGYKDGSVLWQTREVREGNIGTPMIVVPNEPGSYGRWGERYAGDYDFIRETISRVGEPIWHTEVICMVRP